jgi:hypothetical protein
MKRKSLLIVAAFAIVAVCSTFSYAAEYCVNLGGSSDWIITVDADGSIHGYDTLGYYSMAGFYSPPNAYWSLGYYDGVTRPVCHRWNIPTWTGNGVARNADGSVDKWTYGISLCTIPDGGAAASDGVNAATGK